MSEMSYSEAWDRLQAIATLRDQIALNSREPACYLEAVLAVSNGDERTTRDHVSLVLYLCTSALVSLLRHDVDPAGNRWTDDEISGALFILETIAG